MLPTIGHFLFRYRNALFPVAVVPLFLPGPEPFGDTWVATLLGAMVAALGQLVRVVTIGYRYVIRGGRGRRVYAEDLVTDGIYAHVRNPMYVSVLAIILGQALSCAIVGSPETVRQGLDAFLARTGADELMVTAQVFDHAARVRSFEILAEVNRALSQAA